MPLTLTIEKYSPATNPDCAHLLVGFSGAYTAGGDTLNLTPSTWKDPKCLGLVGPSSPPAVLPEAYGNLTVAGADGFEAVVVPGATLATYKLQIFQPNGNEIAAAAYNWDAGRQLQLKVWF